MATQRIYGVGDYPKDVTLRDGAMVTVKPMLTQDARALLIFFQGIPVEDRYYLKEDVVSPEVITFWARDLDYSRTLPLLAWSPDGNVVADASLHRTRTLARHHMGEIRVVVSPEYRGQGLGVALINEFIEIARHRGLELLTVELVAEGEQAAIRAVESVGFRQIAVLPKHAKDLNGNPKDLVLLEMWL